MAHSNEISRRTFLRRLLGGATALGLGSLGAWKLLRSEQTPIQGAILGANAEVGHLLRRGLQKTPSERSRTRVLVVGGGMAGLSAGWWLRQQGHSDFRILELDRKVGGNAVSGASQGHAYPWGAHYLPLPNPGNRDLLHLLESLGCITGWEGERPVYEPLYLCHAPQERLLMHGVWQEGLVPRVAPGSPAAKEMDRFFRFVKGLRDQKDAAGRYLFDIPLAASSADPVWTVLDGMSFAAWLDREGYRSPELRWYLNYCTRDDFGAEPERVSAWAGLHYFAARRGTAANAPDNSVLTWPEGNGWLVNQMAEQLTDHVQTEALVLSLTETTDSVRALVYHPARDVTEEIIADRVVCAIPRFVLRHLVRDLPAAVAGSDFVYAPWAVANVHLRKRPSGDGRPLSWDNVAYGRDSLGYIVSDHQRLQRPGGPTVLTWYEALSQAPPAAVRKEVLGRDWAYWRDRVVADLAWMHPGIEGEVERVDVYVWGHGMISPRPGFLGDPGRELAAKSQGRLHFAHTDLSGMSLFEEAFYQGTRAAREVLGEEASG